MAFDAHKDFAISTVATAPSPATSGTSLIVSTGDGAKFPAVPFNAVVWPAGAQPTTANAEIVRVTAKSTDTLTITRTQEGTSARTIIVGDQIANTITAKVLTDIEDRITTPGLTFGINVKDYGAVGDVTTVGTGGTDDTAALNAALAALPTVNGNPAGKLIGPAGIYRIDGPLNNWGPCVSFEGEGEAATILDYRGSGDCVRLYDPVYPTVGVAEIAGRLEGFCIDGTSAGAGATGLHAGDVLELGLDLLVQNFTGAGSTGVIFDNSVSFTERLHGRVTVQNCTNGVTFTVSGTGQSASSFDYCNLEIDLLKATNGVTLQNGAQIASGKLRIIGNFVYSVSGTPAVLTVTGQVPGITFRATATAIQTSSGGGTLTINKPAGTVSGDVEIAVIEVNGSANLPATPAGWTLLDSGSTGPSVATYYKVAGGSEPASYSWTVANIASGVIATYTGCDPVSPINAHGALNRTTGTSATATSITTTAPCRLVYVMGTSGNGAITDPSGYTRRGRADDSVTATQTLLDDVDQASSGATGTVTGTFGGAVNAYSGLIALKPTGSHPGQNGYSSIYACELDVHAEVRPGSNATQPHTIEFGAAGNFIIGTGNLVFTQGSDSGGTGVWLASNNSGNLQKWLGLIFGDTALNSHNDLTPVAVGGFNNP